MPFRRRKPENISPVEISGIILSGGMTPDSSNGANRFRVNFVQHGEMGVGDFGPILQEPLDVNRHIALSLTLHPIEHPLADPYSKSR